MIEFYLSNSTQSWKKQTHSLFQRLCFQFAHLQPRAQSILGIGRVEQLQRGMQRRQLLIAGEQRVSQIFVFNPQPSTQLAFLLFIAGTVTHSTGWFRRSSLHRLATLVFVTHKWRPRSKFVTRFCRYVSHRNVGDAGLHLRLSMRPDEPICLVHLRDKRKKKVWHDIE